MNWQRSTRNSAEGQIVKKAHESALDFLGTISDPKVRSRYDSHRKQLQLKRVVRPIILNLLDVCDSSQKLVLDKAGIPEDFLKKHKIDDQYVTETLFALMSVGFVSFRIADDASCPLEVEIGESLQSFIGTSIAYDRSENINQCVWFDETLFLSDACAELVSDLSTKAIRSSFPKDKRIRSDVARDTYEAMSAILANLHQAYKRDPSLFMAISLRVNTYIKDVYGPVGLTYAGISRSINYLKSIEPKVVIHRAGNSLRKEDYNSEFIFRRATRVRALDNLIKLIDISLSEGRTKGDVFGSSFPLTDSTFSIDADHIPKRNQIYKINPDYSPAVVFRLAGVG